MESKHRTAPELLELTSFYLLRLPTRTKIAAILQKTLSKQFFVETFSKPPFFTTSHLDNCILASFLVFTAIHRKYFTWFCKLLLLLLLASFHWPHIFVASKALKEYFAVQSYSFIFKNVRKPQKCYPSFNDYFVQDIWVGNVEKQNFFVSFMVMHHVYCWLKHFMNSSNSNDAKFLLQLISGVAIDAKVY